MRTIYLALLLSLGAGVVTSTIGLVLVAANAKAGRFLLAPGFVLVWFHGPGICFLDLLMFAAANVLFWGLVAFPVVLVGVVCWRRITTPKAGAPPQ